MPAGFTNASGTDWTFNAGTSNATQTVARPSSSTTDDIVVVLRHHSAGSAAISSGTVDANLTTGLYLATGSTSQHAQYRRITSSSDQSSGWGWSSSGSSWAHAAVRITGCETSGNPFTPGTLNGGSNAGEGVLGWGTSITLVVGDGAANDLGAIFVVSTAAVSSVSAGWTATQLGSTQRYITVITRAYTGTVTADSCVVSFGTNAAALTRHGVFQGIAGTPATATPAAVTATASVPSATVTTSSPNVTVTPAAVTATATARAATVDAASLYRVTVAGDSITEGTQVGVGNRWMDLLFGSQGSITNGVWWNGAGSGVPFPGKRIYSATYQGDSVIETTNRAYNNAKTDVTADGEGRTTDLLILCFGANDQLDSLPGGITKADDSNPAHSMQWFEDNVVQLGNGGIQSGTTGANPSNVNNLPKARYVLLVGQWEWRSGGPTLNGVGTNAAVLSRLAAARTRIAALSHVDWCGLVTVGSDADQALQADGSAPGVDTATAPNGGYGLGGSDYIHPSVSGQAVVMAPTVRAGINQLLEFLDPDATVTPAAVTATASIPAPTVSAQRSATATPSAVTATAAVPAPTVSAAARPTPPATTATVAVPTPTVLAGGSTTATPSAVTATAAVPAPGVAGHANRQAPPVTATAAVPTPTVLAGGSTTVTPAAVAATAAVPAPIVTASRSATVVASVVAGTAAVPSATVSTQGSATAAPAAVTSTAAVPAVTVTASSSVTVAAAAVAATATVHAVTVAADGNTTVTAVAVTATVAVPTPTVLAGGAATATPAAVAAVAAVPAPTVITQRHALVAPAPVNATVTVGQVLAVVAVIAQRPRSTRVQRRVTIHKDYR